MIILFVVFGLLIWYAGAVYITEIQPRTTENLDEYIILTSTWAFQGQLKIHWLWRGNDYKNINLQICTWCKVILSENYLLSWQDISPVLVTGINLKDTGELIKIYQDDKLHDQVDYAKPDKWKSMYYTKTISWIRLFNTQNSPLSWLNIDNSLTMLSTFNPVIYQSNDDLLAFYEQAFKSYSQHIQSNSYTVYNQLNLQDYDQTLQFIQNIEPYQNQVDIYGQTVWVQEFQTIHNLLHYRVPLDDLPDYALVYTLDHLASSLNPK